MSTAPVPAPEPHPPGCSALPAALAELEGAAGDAASLARLAEVRLHLASCTACHARHAAAADRLEGLCALRSRAVPRRALEGLSTQVLARVRSGVPGGMSPAFLDAPRSLARWRSVALAASLLLAASAGLFATGRLAWRAPGQDGRDPALRDVRDTLLLRRDDPRREALAEDLAVTPVVFPGRGRTDFWGRPARPAPRAPAANDTGE